MRATVGTEPMLQMKMASQTATVYTNIENTMAKFNVEHGIEDGYISVVTNGVPTPSRLV